MKSKKEDISGFEEKISSEKREKLRQNLIIELKEGLKKQQEHTEDMIYLLEQALHP